MANNNQDGQQQKAENQQTIQRQLAAIERIYGPNKDLLQKGFVVSEGLVRIWHDDSCFHVRLADGKPAYPQRYLRAGHFEGGFCWVIDASGAFHIKSDGMPVYQERFKAAGYFSEGVAWVQLGDRRFRFITPEGKFAFEGVFDDVTCSFIRGRAEVKQGKKFFGLTITATEPTRRFFDLTHHQFLLESWWFFIKKLFSNSSASAKVRLSQPEAD